MENDGALGYWIILRVGILLVMMLRLEVIQAGYGLELVCLILVHRLLFSGSFFSSLRRRCLSSRLRVMLSWLDRSIEDSGMKNNEAGTGCTRLAPLNSVTQSTKM